MYSDMPVRDPAEGPFFTGYPLPWEHKKTRKRNLPGLCAVCFAEARLLRQPSTPAPSAHPRGAFLSYGNEVSYTIKNPEEKSSGSVRCLLWVSSASAKTHQKKQSSSSIQTVLSASEFPSAPIAEGSPNHAPLTYTAKGSWAIPPVGTCTRP